MTKNEMLHAIDASMKQAKIEGKKHEAKKDSSGTFKLAEVLTVIVK